MSIVCYFFAGFLCMCFAVSVFLEDGFCLMGLYILNVLIPVTPLCI